ncbi:hAT family C-terminal dimerization region [Phytophthora infestans]|uniref:HAT family C-terminal dimerization region n=1 Tax=Phytophthora infestans TaxID=4787 RepID=A0A833SMM2_PHYIN|nr:hAT family C-terminal dimerization region [Phytophthora infestans]KAF4150651.1 hAT family C-terminal dimerization region [Phytophthora infestans]
MAEGKAFLVSEAMYSTGADIDDVDSSTSLDEESDEEEEFMNELLGGNRSSAEPRTHEALTVRQQVNAEVNKYLENAHKMALIEKQKKKAEKKQKNEEEAGKRTSVWRQSYGDYPLLAPVARNFFGIVATSVSSERCFSWTGNVITARRNRLTGSNVRDLIFLYSNSVEEGSNEAESNFKVYRLRNSTAEHHD